MKRELFTAGAGPQSVSPYAGTLLKAAIFATGLSGIVAEYVMSTLASYLLGNEVVQWTQTISTMLFAMGVGSRMSKHIRSRLLESFILIELILSLLCAISALMIYSLSIFIDWVGPLIYSLAFLIGLLIGLEIPLATRLNEVFEDLRLNISSIMEKDYYGALLGGLLFAFVTLPLLGLTYTPILLGLVNLLVAAALFRERRQQLEFRKWFGAAFIALPLLLGGLAFQAEAIVLYAEQTKYVDRVIYQEQTPYQKIVITRWHDDYWLYLNGNQQFSSYDEERYHEPLVHPAMSVTGNRSRILILGGGDGLALREVLRYPDVLEVVLVDLDPSVTRLGREHPVFRRLNGDAMHDPRLHLVHEDAYKFLKEDGSLYDVVIIDLPDPKSVSLARLYSHEFYQLVGHHLSPGGVMVTQATSPFFSRETFLSIWKSVAAAGFTSAGYHNHIPTLGEWGWVLGVKGGQIARESLKARLRSLDFEGRNTRFLNAEVMGAMLSFGKDELNGWDDIKVNHELDLAAYTYYRKGTWAIY